MKYFRNILMQLLFFLVISQAYSEDTKHISRIFKSINKMYLVSAAQNPQAAKILSEILNKEDYTANSLKAITIQVESANQNRQEALKELQSKMPHFNNMSFNDNEKIPINFVDLRIDDAIVMLEMVKISPQLTIKMLITMRELAILAANSASSSDDLRRLDFEFKNYKAAMEYAQSIGLIDGVKNISGGNLKITFGNGKAKTSVLNINLPSIDSKSLGIDELNLLSYSNAIKAVTIIDQAISLVNKYSVIASDPVITDLEVMIVTMPYMLYQNFNLVIDARDLILQGLTSVVSDYERDLMDIEFNYLKSAMQKTQTYLSLSGPITTGEGKITIQIGETALPETMLEIDLPATDIHVIGIDKLDIKTFTAANEALLSIINIMKNFVYYPTTCSSKHSR